jgi:ribosomal protein L5
MINLKDLLLEWNAQTVLKQLGGNKFIMMTGAKNFVQDAKKRMIGFKIGRNSKSINYVRITLNGMDTYDMEFLRIRGGKVTVVKEVKGVYNDQLQSIFTKYTGLYTHL